MTNTQRDFAEGAARYLELLHKCFTPVVISRVETLAIALHDAWITGKNVYICGNGGSAANAIHIANDLHYGIGACGSGPRLPGLRIEALPANAGVITCLANDTGYENVYSHQLEVKARQEDILIVLSGSGNSSNIIKALKTAERLGLKSFAILAFDGGQCRAMVDTPIHLEVTDMQIAEDTQLVVGHLCMQWLNRHKPKNLNPLH